MHPKDNILLDERIRRSLPFTWSIFFSKFGKLTSIQRAAIPLILQGFNVVITSQKATGKTEAVLAPVAERWLADQVKELSVVYISPTRALVNDIYIRMKPIFDYLDIPITRRTGDHPEFRKGRITPFLITTPESLDSLISRYPQLFTGVKDVIIDEVHLMHNSYRGDQLRILIRRLKRISKAVLRVYVMSATICDAKSIGEKFIEDDFKIATRKAPLSIDYRLLKGSEFMDSISDEIAKRNLKKLLFFTNSRFEAEETAKLLVSLPFGRNVWVHHGSMSRIEREEVERAFNRTKIGACVATSTLEFGIDIGDIDATVLIKPPPNAASLLQRMGRGNRRKENYVLAYGVYIDEIQKIVFEQLFEDAKNEDYLSLEHSFDLSVTCQQILSYVYQKIRIGTSTVTLKRLFEGIVDVDDLDEIIESLIAKGFIKTGKSRLLYPGEKMSGAVSLGTIHSNIPDGKEFEVYDAQSGKLVGKVDNPFPSFTLGGRDWTIVSVESNRIWVKYQGTSDKVKNVFIGRNIGFWDFKFGIRMKRRFFPKLKDNEIPYTTYEDYFHILHFTGPIYSFIWSYALKDRIQIGEVGDVVFVSESTDIKPTCAELENAIKKSTSAMTYYMNPGRYYNLLSRELRERQVYSFLNVREFTEWLSVLKLVEIAELSQ